MKNVLIVISLVAATMGCNNKENTKDQIQAARQSAIDSVNRVVEIERMKQATIDSMNLIREEEQQIAEAKKANTAVKTKETVVYRDGSSNSGYTPVSYAPAAPAKKKMSNAAKGALIGAGVGALTGVAVAKDKKGKGALIGAGAGAAAGAITGVIVDKQKKKKQAQSQPQIYY